MSNKKPIFNYAVFTSLFEIKTYFINKIQIFQHIADQKTGNYPLFLGKNGMKLENMKLYLPYYK